MKTNFLFPYKVKGIGFTLFVVSLLLGIVHLIYRSEPEWLDMRVFTIVNEPVLSPKTYFTWIDNNIADELIGSMMIIGGLFLGFSKQKSEDEFIAKLRMDSLIWAVYVQYGLLLLSFWLLYGLSFYWIMLINLFVLLFFFNGRFYWLLNQYNKAAVNEE